MTSTETAAANAPLTSESAAPVNAPKPSRKRLKALSDADEKPITSSPSPTSKRKARHIVSADASAAGDVIYAVPEQPRQTKASIVEALLT